MIAARSVRSRVKHRRRRHTSVAVRRVIHVDVTWSRHGEICLSEKFISLLARETSFVDRPFGPTMLVPHGSVSSTQSQEVFVCPTLRDRAVMQDDNLVSVGDCRQPVTAVPS